MRSLQEQIKKKECIKELRIALNGRPSRSLMPAAHLLHGEMDNTEV